MKRCVIIGAAEIKNYDKIRTFLTADDFFIFCDGGLKHEKLLNVQPNLIIGDFDSFNRPEDSCGAEVIQLPCEKDDTDLFYAAKEACKRGFTDFLMLGVIGQRFDHSICNISVLIYLREQGKNAKILDDFSEMELLIEKEEPVRIKDNFAFFSLMCVAGDVNGVTIKNAKYPLENSKITSGYQFGISNEVLPGKEALVSLEKGYLLLIKVWPEA